MGQGVTLCDELRPLSNGKMRQVHLKERIHTDCALELRFLRLSMGRFRPCHKKRPQVRHP